MGKVITDFSAVTTVGLDLARHVFQVHAVDACGRVIAARAVSRGKLLEARRRVRTTTYKQGWNKGANSARS